MDFNGGGNVMTNAKNETTSERVASIAAKGLVDPNSLTTDEVRAVCASALTQSPNGISKLQQDLLDKAEKKS